MDKPVAKRSYQLFIKKPENISNYDNLISQHKYFNYLFQLF